MIEAATPAYIRPDRHCCKNSQRPMPRRLYVALDGLGDLPDPAHEHGELVRLERLRAVRQGLLGLGMHLDQQAVSAGRDPGHRHRLDVLPVSGPVAGIDDHRQVRELLEHRHRVEVEGEARGRLEGADPPLAQDDVRIAPGQHVLLCERGIRTFETATSFTLDLNAVPVLKKLTHLPVVVDPSHGTGHWEYVEAMAMAAVAAGADGLIIEVHPKPEEALSDGPQSLKPDRFAAVMARVARVARAIDRDV